MTVHLHTRSLCDNCPSPAFIDLDGIFLCSECAVAGGSRFNSSSCGGVESRHAAVAQCGRRPVNGLPTDIVKWSTRCADTAFSRQAGIASGPQDSIPTPVHTPESPAPETSARDLDVRSAPLSFSNSREPVAGVGNTKLMAGRPDATATAGDVSAPGSRESFDAEVSALEADWAGRGVDLSQFEDGLSGMCGRGSARFARIGCDRNAMTFRTMAASAISSNDISVPVSVGE